ncbi:hypothetical protein ACTWQL_01325 [Pseudalkalibacillus sp. R45]|uniref:hypothetical protein n=1 Tax=Pseudalkalibacillus sp. R45 TaxID=3457433 RepID=UPI003FCDACD8
MQVKERLSTSLGRTDQEPNIQLAQDLVQNKDKAGVEIVIHLLDSKDKNLQSDAIKVAYEVGTRNPELLRGYTLHFIDLLKSRHNRMVWGGMTALATIAVHEAKEISGHLDTILSTMKNGSVITVDQGVKVLAGVASVNDNLNNEIFPYLLEHLQNCRTKEIPQHAESTLIAINTRNKEAFLEVLKEREQYLTPPQLKRVKKIYKTLD